MEYPLPFIIECPFNYQLVTEGFDCPNTKRIVASRKVVFFADMVASEIAWPNPDYTPDQRFTYIANVSAIVEGYRRMAS